MPRSLSSPAASTGIDATVTMPATPATDRGRRLIAAARVRSATIAAPKPANVRCTVASATRVSDRPIGLSCPRHATRLAAPRARNTRPATGTITFARSDGASTSHRRPAHMAIAVTTTHGTASHADNAPGWARILATTSSPAGNVRSRASARPCAGPGGGRSNENPNGATTSGPTSQSPSSSPIRSDNGPVASAKTTTQTTVPTIASTGGPVAGRRELIRARSRARPRAASARGRGRALPASDPAAGRGPRRACPAPSPRVADT